MGVVSVADSSSHVALSHVPARSRSVAVDLVRLLGLTVVVVGHVWDTYPISGYVAVFFVLSGYLWSERRPLVDEVRHKVRILLVPYLAWLILVGGAAVLRSALRGAEPGELAHRVARLAWGGERATQPLTAFWFLTAIFTATVLYRLLRLLPRWAFATTIALALAVTTVGTLAHAAPLAVGVGALSVVFVAAGHAFRVAQRRIAHPLLVAATLALVGVAALATGTSTRMALKYSDFGTPVISVVVAVMLCLAALLIAQRVQHLVPDRLGAGLTWVVRASTVIIVLHTVPIWLLPDWPRPAHLVLGFGLPLLVAAALLRFPTSRARQWLMPGR
jgi:fucose 4-O-acetylase-like acetyltransferase